MLLSKDCGPNPSSNRAEKGSGDKVRFPGVELQRAEPQRGYQRKEKQKSAKGPKVGR